MISTREQCHEFLMGECRVIRLGCFLVAPISRLVNGLQLLANICCKNRKIHGNIQFSAGWHATVYYIAVHLHSAVTYEQR